MAALRPIQSPAAATSPAAAPSPIPRQDVSCAGADLIGWVRRIVFLPRRYSANAAARRRLPEQMLRLFRCRRGVQKDVALDADLPDQVELAVDEIDVVFFCIQNHYQQVARNEVAHALTVGDALTQIGHCLFLQREVGPEDLLDILADGNGIKPLHVGQAAQEQDALY